jgi:hypothetical protein
VLGWVQRRVGVKEYRIRVVIPESRRLTLEFPAAIPPGPIEVIVVPLPPEVEMPSTVPTWEVSEIAELPGPEDPLV